jgi:hypothetical protein
VLVNPNALLKIFKKGAKKGDPRNNTGISGWYALQSPENTGRLGWYANWSLLKKSVKDQRPENTAQSGWYAIRYILKFLKKLKSQFSKIISINFNILIFRF